MGSRHGRTGLQHMCVDDDDDDHGCYVDEEDWNAEYNENAAYIDRRWMWAAVMAEAVKARRPRVLLDRRGCSLPPLVLAP